MASCNGGINVQENAESQPGFPCLFMLLIPSSMCMDANKEIVYQALLSGCSAGGLASIIHCDEFRSMLPKSTKVKCLSDAGFFLDA